MGGKLAKNSKSRQTLNDEESLPLSAEQRGEKSGGDRATRGDWPSIASKYSVASYVLNLILCVFLVAVAFWSISAKWEREAQTKASTVHESSYYENWCPGCTDPVLCSRRFLFIVATGRSGSTTVMNMVNQIPGVYVSGENNMILRSLSDFNKGVDSWRNSFNASFAKRIKSGHLGSWGHARINKTNVYSDLQSLIWHTFAPPANMSGDIEVRGFKEIRWSPEHLSFLAQVCPCSRFILNFRNDLQAQHKSAFQKSKSIDELEATQSLDVAVRSLNRPVFSLPLESFNVPEFNKLAAWMGVRCNFNRVLHANGGMSGYEEDWGGHVGCRLHSEIDP